MLAQLKNVLALDKLVSSVIVCLTFDVVVLL